MNLLVRFTLLLAFYICFATTCSVAQAPTNGLVAYYPFNGNAIDESGNGNNATPQNGVTFGVDRFGNSGKAAKFDGVDDYISTNFPSQSSIINSVTLSSWIRINDFYNGWFPILEKPTSTNQGSFHLSYENGASSLYFFLSGISGTSSISKPLSKSQWYSCIVTYDGSLRKFYIDGQLIGTSVASGQINLTNTGLEIGRDTPGLVEYANGQLDDIRIYNRALSDTEVQQLYRAFL